ncbi:MAG: TonB-dependent receptor [Bacteroidales bacterium]|nr:TonB-dependent receptor [Bacteroidales bacterium]
MSTGGYTDPPAYSPAVGGVGTQSLSASFNLNEKFKFRLSGNYTYRDRAQSDIYFFLSERLQVSDPVYYPVDSVVIQGSDPKKMFKNPNRGLQAYGVNGLMSYVINPDIYFDLTTGLQRSTAISSNLDFYFFAHTTRQMETQYFNLRSKIHGFNIQAGYMWGYGDMAMGIPGLKSDMGNFNFNIDYNYRWNNININPGFYFAYNTMNGDKNNQSFFHGKQVLRSYAPSLRLDYTPCEQLRFIGALRLEKNEIPDKAYLTWQLAGNYKFNENSLIRAVYSRANRSPFMMDVRINSTVSLDFGQLQTNPDDPKNIVNIGMRGDENLKLAIMDMYELGYRQKIGNHILLNVELFHSRIKDLNAAELKEMRVTFGDPQVLRFYPYLMDFSFENISDKQEQTGGTIEIGVVANKQLSFRLWGTLQHTEIRKHNRNSSTMMKLGEVFAAAVISGRLNDYKVDDNDYRFLDTDLTTDLVSVKSESTPSFYGGYEMTWKIGKKVSLFSNGYGFTEQSYANQFYSADIKSKMLINAKIGYHFVENATLSLSVNNILNATSQEYGFMDKVGTQWYLGFNVKF